MTYLAPPPGQAPVVVVRDVGGYVDQYREQTEQYRRENREVQLHECRSACTLALSLPNVCVFPDSIVKFHKAYDEHTKVADESVSQQLMASYPAAVQARLGQLTRNYRALRGAELIELGIRDCNEKRTILVAKNTPPAEKQTGIAKAMESIVSTLLNPGDALGDTRSPARVPAIPAKTAPVQVASITSDLRPVAVPLPPVNIDAAFEIPLPPRRPADLSVVAAAPPMARQPMNIIPGALPVLPTRFMAFAPLQPMRADMITSILR